MNSLKKTLNYIPKLIKNFQMQPNILISIILLITTTNALLQTPYGLPPDLNANEPSTVIHPLMQWLGGSFSWPCKPTKSLYKSSGKYINKHIIATRGQIAQDEVFLALPRYKSGVPATLVKTKLSSNGCHTTFEPFPCWSMQEEGNCQALQSVVDVFIDNNSILWVLDIGITNTLENPVRKCPAKIVAFNVKTGKVLKLITLEGLTTQTSRLQYLVVDYSPDSRCYVYVSDASTRSIIVYDVRASRGFRIVLPNAVTSGSSKRDVLYLALVRKSCGSTVLYFTYLGSKRIFAIRTEYLRKGYAQGRVTGTFNMKNI